MSLIHYAETPRQRQIVELKEAGRTWAEITDELGSAERSIRQSFYVVKKRAAKQGYSPEHDLIHTVPDGFKVKGVSTYYNNEGLPAGQWVKSSEDRERQAEIMKAAVAAMCEEIVPLKKTKAPRIKESDLLNLYVITDYHMGMLAWGEETGADWDLNIAEETLIRWFQIAIDKAPDTSHCVFTQLGDFLHFDSLEAVTPASKHLLDSDTRYQKLVRTCIRVTRQVISMLLEKHRYVHIKWCDANHDPAGSVWMRELLVALYDKEPRVEIDNSADTYYAYEWGSTILFFHHGHKRKVKDVDTVFTAKFREEYGRTEHAYAHTGHLHSVDVDETNLMIVEQHRTLAAPDAYASRGGWISGREASVITYHKKYGQVGRDTISYKMVEFNRKK